MSSLCSELPLYLCMYKCECACNSHVHVWLRMRASVISCACVRVCVRESTHGACVIVHACVWLCMWSHMRVCMIAYACECDRACMHVQMSIQWGMLIWRPQVNAECPLIALHLFFFFGFFLFFWFFDSGLALNRGLTTCQAVWSAGSGDPPVSTSPGLRQQVSTASFGFFAHGH